MSKTCFLFPGQGAQYVGMGKDIYDESETVRELFEHASDVVGKDMKRLLFDSDETELARTDNTQAAITLMNLAAAAFAREVGVEPDGVAGFSLGEYAALHVAGILSFEDTFRAVDLRGRLMEEGARKHDDAVGKAGMTAVLGLSYEECRETLESLVADKVYLANNSSPTQVVLAGTAAGLAKAEKALSDLGAMRVVRLKVSGPFHTPLLREASEAFAAALAEMAFCEAAMPVYANVTGRRLASGEEARTRCAEQIVSPVRWVDEEQAILDDGFDRVVEIGPGKVLAGLWKSYTRAFRCKPAGTVEQIRAIGGSE